MKYPVTGRPGDLANTMESGFQKKKGFLNENYGDYEEWATVF